jgi:hypothetical protein
MKTAIIAVVLLLGAAHAGAQGVDSCLKFEFPNHYFDTLRWEAYMNDDSVKIDSCPTSPTYLEYYATKGWGMDFKYYVIKRQPAPYDTTIELSWSAIDTAYVALRAAFAAMETKYGTFYLGEERPDSYDSTAPGNRSYGIRFDNYVCIDSVNAMLQTFPDLDSNFPPGFGDYPAWADGGLGGVTVHSMKNEGLSINPNPASAALTITATDSKGIHSIELFDVLGQRILDLTSNGGAELSIDVRSLANGVYILVCDNEIEANVIIAH